MKRIVVIRTIRYEGDEKWIRETLARSFLQLDKPFDVTKGRKITLTEEREVQENAASKRDTQSR